MQPLIIFTKGADIFGHDCIWFGFLYLVLFEINFNVFCNWLKLPVFIMYS